MTDEAPAHVCALKGEEPKHKKDLHGWIICKEVWMPEEGFYFCDADCIKKYNGLLKKRGVTAKSKEEAKAQSEKAGTPISDLHILPVQIRPR